MLVRRPAVARIGTGSYRRHGSRNRHDLNEGKGSANYGRSARGGRVAGVVVRFGSSLSDRRRPPVA